MTSRRVLITGASGYLGSRLASTLVLRSDIDLVVATDVRVPSRPVPGVAYEMLDITDGRRLSGFLADYRIDTVAHLAWDGGQWGRDAYEVDVEGTRNVLQACVERGVGRLVVTSSDDVYGFLPRTAEPLGEQTPRHPHEELIESAHKTLAEQACEEIAEKEPGLQQVVLRLAPVLGPGALNGLIALFGLPELYRESGVDSRYCFVHADDAVGAIARALTGEACGTFNVVADGSVDVDTVAAALGRPVRAGSRRALRRHLEKRARRGEQALDADLLDLLLHRPVLDGEALRSALGYAPRHSARATLDAWLP